MSPAATDHHHHDHHHHDCDGHHHHHDDVPNPNKLPLLLPEELAEEEDMKLYGFNPIHHHHHHHDDAHDSNLTTLVQGKPSKALVDSLALFGAGAMLGDAFLHQLPHAFGGQHSHSHDDHHAHDSHPDHSHAHAHSLADLSVGLSVLAGILLFLLVEKIVRYVDQNSGEATSWSHAHHHHHHNSTNKIKDDSKKKKSKSSKKSKGKASDEASNDSLNGDIMREESLLRKRKSSSGAGDDRSSDVDDSDDNNKVDSVKKETAKSSSSLVFGYLNLFSDGVHNFTDGMALGSAFLLYGSVGGWSRTLFLLAHELPQEIGDFGILVRSGFSVSKALFFNFLSALVALVGTVLALLWGQDAGHSSLIEGFTAGGFIYIAVAGVLAEINNNGSSSIRSTAAQSTSLVLGMAVALCISLVE
ncbi:hypothetical protein ACFE04_020605 [Oxalis oulophora]